MENKDSNKEQAHEVKLLPAIATGLKMAVKSWANNTMLLNSATYPTGDGVAQDIPVNDFFTQTWFQRLTGNHSFNRKGLKYLIETGYNMNPSGFGIINKILLCQRNINFVPYWKGKPYLSKTFNFDVYLALQMLMTTGTVMCYKKKIVGFPDEIEVLNTVNVDEVYYFGKLYYKVDLLDGTTLKLSEDDIIFIKFIDLTACRKTNMGISPLQAAIMPIEALKEMYTADTAMLKNKGVDVMITNDSDEPIRGTEQDEFDRALNDRISGARRAGGVATSTKKLRVLNLGRTVKELALWDGFKIKLRDLCNVLQVDSGQFNDPDNKKFSNVQESNKALYLDCVIAFTKLITNNKEIIDFLGYEIYLDLSGIDCLQEAQATRFEKNNTITNAIINLNKQVKDGIITYDVAVFLLSNEWQFDEQEAKQVIVLRETDNNETADKLNVLSPIVATKVMESITTNERRDLIGLNSVEGGDVIPTPAPSF